MTCEHFAVTSPIALAILADQCPVKPVFWLAQTDTSFDMPFAKRIAIMEQHISTMEMLTHKPVENCDLIEQFGRGSECADLYFEESRGWIYEAGGLRR